MSMVSGSTAEYFLTFFLAGLTGKAQGRYWPRLQPGNADLIAAFLADSERSVLYPFLRVINLFNQLTLAVAQAKGKCPVSLCRCPIRRISKNRLIFRQFFQGRGSVAAHVVKHLLQKLAKII